MNWSSSVLSLPLSSSVAPCRLPALDAVSCAVWPVAGLSRYSVVTLSDGSWSTISKLRVTGHALPVPISPSVTAMLDDVPADGTFSLPSRSSWKAALKKLTPLQNDTCPKIDPVWPLRQLACLSAVGVAPTWKRSVPLNPKSIVTIASAGRFGTEGVTAGVVPWVITSGL